VFQPVFIGRKNGFILDLICFIGPGEVVGKPVGIAATKPRATLGPPFLPPPTQFGSQYDDNENDQQC
jgi:hypothetical protein